jgi:chromosome partitioning protein
MVVAIVNQKGGVGKTTVAVHISSCFALAGENVLLVDTDPQGSVMQWHALGGHPNLYVHHHPAPLKARWIAKMKRSHPVLVVDSPPELNAIARSVLAAADLAIVPVSPSPLDIWSGRETMELIRAALQRNRGLDVRLLICRKIANTRIGREAREAMEGYGLGVMNTEICQRVAYVESMLAGRSVLQHAPSSPAAREVRGLYAEILSLKGK